MELTNDAVWLMAIRAIKRLSQRKLAEKLGVSPALICYIENGHKPITRDLRMKLAVNFPPDDELRDAIDAIHRTNKMLG